MVNKNFVVFARSIYDNLEFILTNGVYIREYASTPYIGFQLPKLILLILYYYYFKPPSQLKLALAAF